MKSLSLVILIALASGCQGIDKKLVLASGNALTTASASDCSSFDDSTTSHYEYNSLSTCQTTSLANCDANWRTLPSGGVSLCYTPVTGWQSCSSSTTDWIYSSWGTWCDTGSTNASGYEIYRTTRNLVSCSSTTCACLGTQLTTRSCIYRTSDNTGDCISSYAFNPNPSPSPTPAPCP